LGRIPADTAVDALRGRMVVEEDEWVASEIESALGSEEADADLRCRGA
jgi:hypothetical protein